MKSKNYYKHLVQKYFDAQTSQREEDRLKRYLASVDDPWFDEAKAVMGYVCLQRRLHSAHKQRSYAPLWICGSLAAAGLAGALIFGAGWNKCYIREKGVTISDHGTVMASVEETLYDLLSQEADVDSIMYDFINK